MFWKAPKLQIGINGLYTNTIKSLIDELLEVRVIMLFQG